VLDLGDNEITAIPMNIDQLKNLQELILWGNVIGVFPDELAGLKKLKKLDLLNNEMNKEEQDRVKSYLPNAKILLSPPCVCHFDD